jgi:hypothetical protein
MDMICRIASQPIFFHEEALLALRPDALFSF